MPQFLEKVDPEKYFRAANGTVVRSLLELDGALATMSEQTFCFHVNEEANHFFPWIRDVVGDAILASQIENVREKKDMQILILRRIVELFANENK